jgi:hypothetical protein
VTVADILNKAADLIEPEGAWTQGAWQRGRSGREVKPDSPRAVCWCVGGAIEHVSSIGIGSAAMTELRDHLSVMFISEWNDAPERTQAEVVAKLREAAMLSERDG